MTIVKRSVKGQALTHEEMDGNWDAWEGFFDTVATLRVGMVSDIHFNESDNSGITNVLADIDREIPVDLLLSGGDNASAYAAQVAWGNFRETYISRAGIQYLSAEGNHDADDDDGGAHTVQESYDAYIAANGAGSSHFGNQGASNVTVWHNLVIITLGLEKGQRGGNGPSTAAMDWLELMLARYRGHNIIVVHHQPLENSGLVSSTFDIATYHNLESERLQSICAANKICAWFSGHLHFRLTGAPNVLHSAPTGFGGTRFYGIPGAVHGGEWLYFDVTIGDTEVAVKFRNSGASSGTWYSAADSTFPLSYPLKPLNMELSGHIHPNKAILDAILTDPGEGTGDVVGPESATNLSIALFDGTTGKLIKVGPGSFDAFGSYTMTASDVTINNTVEVTAATAARDATHRARVYRNGQTTGTASFTGLTYQGTSGSPVAMASATPICRLLAGTSDGTSNIQAGAIICYTETEFTPTARNACWKFFLTSGSSSAYAEKMQLTSAGKLAIGTGAPPTSGLQILLANIPVYANNAAAVAGGLTAGAFYRTGADPDPICIVH